MAQRITLSEITQAAERIKPYVETTPLTSSRTLSTPGTAVSFKWDNRLPTGSFKERGAANMLLQLSDTQRQRGVIAASAGNHALAVSRHAAALGIPCTIVMPIHAPLVKVSSTRSNGAQVILHGASFDDAAAHCRGLAHEESLTMIPPFDHPQIIAGQGVAGLEILAQAPSVKRVYVPIGGGGLISGIATALKSHSTQIEIVGVESQWAHGYREDRQKGAGSSPCPPPLRALSIADGIAVKSLGTLPSLHLEQYVDRVIRVDEDQIADAVIWFLEHEHTVVEGAGAAALAGYLSEAGTPYEGQTVIEVCGSNIDMNLLARLIERHWSLTDRLLKVSVSVPDRPGALNALTEIIASLGGNIMRVSHDRSFAETPGNVHIGLVVECSHVGHKKQIIEGLQQQGVTLVEE